MKKLLLLLLVASVATAQFNNKINFNLLADKTAHFVAEMEGIEGKMYFKQSLELAPNIDGGYLATGTAVGFSTELGMFQQYRIYTAPKLQFILRGGNVYPSAGFELGIDKTFNSGFIIGIRGSYDYRSDFNYWDRYAAEWRPSGFVKVGWRIR
jgi:hypothetical protein